MRTDTLKMLEGVTPDKSETLAELGKIGSVHNQLRSLQQQQQIQQANVRAIVTDFDTVLEKVRDKSQLELEALTDEEVNALYTDENGEEIQMNLPKKVSEKEIIDLKKDFLIYMINTEKVHKQIDEEKVKLQEALDEFQEENRAIHDQYNGNIAAYVRTLLGEQYNELEDGARKDAIKIILDAFDDASELTRIIDTYKSLPDITNTVSDFIHNYENIAKKFHRNCKEIGIAVDLSSFTNFEGRLLEEKYHKHPNLFVFLIIKWFARKKNINKADGVFLTQLASELRQLYLNIGNDAATEAELAHFEKFKNSARELLDVVYGK